ncbi:MAG: hypothetical protein JWN93_1410 [Hyphomicrobiales bacterium]|nr:hypothetical protein [Hyphomicrobiales bacterium]
MNPVKKLALVTVLAIAPVIPALAQGADYKLQASDKVRINVIEWSTSGGDSRARMSGEFKLSPGGEVALPLLGLVPAAGLTARQLSETITRLIAEKAALLTTPVTTVEIVDYRPIFILGAVDKPGEYAYRPDMVAVHALALAGGVYRRTDLTFIRVDREITTAEGEIRILQKTSDELTIRRARLQAEVENLASFSMSGLTLFGSSTEDSSRSIHREQTMLRVRREDFQSELAARAKLMVLAEEQKRFLSDAVAIQDARESLLRKEVDEVRSLINKGLTSIPRQLAAETALADAAFRKKDLQAQLSQASQALITNEQQTAALKARRTASLVGEAQQVEREIDETRNKMRTARKLRAEAEALLSYSPLTNVDFSAVTFRLLRDGKPAPASETTKLNPGDVVMIVGPREGLRDTGAGSDPAPGSKGATED